jgi:hypothetical protein
MSVTIRYQRLAPEAPIGVVGPERPFLAMVIIRDAVSPEWQWDVSQWLVAAGCLYMCAWGPGCSSWDDSVDYANLERHSYGDVPDERVVMTTWHAHEALEEALWFAKHTAKHPAVELDLALIIDVSHRDHREDALALWAAT